MARWWNIPPRNWKDNTRTCLKSQVGHTRKRARGQSQRKPFPSGYRDPGQAHQRTAEPAGTGSQRRLRSRSLPRGGRLRGERLRKVPREIGSSNVFPPMLSPPKGVRKLKTDSDPAKPRVVTATYHKKA